MAPTDILPTRRQLLVGAVATGLTACSREEPVPPGRLPACTPASPGPGDAFAAARLADTARIELASRVAGRFVADNDPTKLDWDWGEAVGCLGLVDLYRVTGDALLRDFYRAWIDRHLEVGYKHLLTSSDRCPPALAALALYVETCEPRYGQVVLDVLDYLDRDALRTEEGGINHLGVLDTFGVSLWLDSLFMFGNVLVRWGELAGDAKALDLFSSQLDIFASLLQDESGWFKHAHGWELAEQEDGVFWARGNAWVSAAGYEYLRVRAARGESDAGAEAILQSQIEAIVAAQDEATGLWWTVPNRPGETYLETSASALFAVGLARGYRYGLLDASVLPVVDKALAGVATRVEADGTVHGISGPTSVGDFAYYAGIEQGDNIHYGVGAVILAAIESAGLTTP